MTTLHVAHAMRMQLPHGDEDDEYDGAFQLATKNYFEYEVKKFLTATPKQIIRSNFTEHPIRGYETRYELCVPRANLLWPVTLKEAIERILNIEHPIALPDTLALLLLHRKDAVDNVVNQSTLRCPSSLQLTLNGQQHMFQLVGAIMASTDARRPHEAYLLTHGLTNQWCVATDGDALMDCEMCSAVSVQALNYYLDGYASSANGDATHHKYPLRLWYRSQAALVSNSEVAEERQMQAETERILKNKHRAEQEARERQHALAQYEVKEQQRRLKSMPTQEFKNSGLPAPHARYHLEKELEKLQAEEKAAWERVVAAKAGTRSDKRSHKAAIEARRQWEAKEAQRRVRELNEQVAKRAAAVAERRAAAAKEHRERLAKLHFRAWAAPAFQRWECVSAPYRDRARLWRELERQRADAALAAKREQAEQALIADTEERRLARLEREQAELEASLAESGPKLKQRNKQPGLDRTAKTPEEQARWEAERAAIKEKNRLLHEEKRLEAERRRAEEAKNRVKWRPMMDLKDWALDEPRGSRRPVDDDARSVCSVASSAITTTTTTSLPGPSKHARYRARGYSRGANDRPVRKHDLQDAKKNGATQRGANGNIVHRGRHATLVTDPTGKTAVTAWSER